MADNFGSSFSDAFSTQQKIETANIAQRQEAEFKQKALVESNIKSTLDVAAQITKAAADAGKDPQTIAGAIQPLIESAAELAGKAYGPDGAMRVQRMGQALLARPPLEDKTNKKLVNIPGGVETGFQPQPHVYDMNAGTLAPLQAAPPVTPAAPINPMGRQSNLGEVTGVEYGPVETNSPNQRVAQGFQDSGMLPAGAAPAASTGAPLYNEEVLAKAPPEVASVVKAIANYDTNIKNLSLRTGERKQFIGLVRQYYPEWDEKIFAKALRAETAFTSGTQGNGIRSLNQVFGHIQNWLDDVAELKNFQTSQFGVGTQAANRMRQWTLENKQDPRVTKVENDGIAIANELEKAFRGSQTAISGVQEWGKRFQANLSPQASEASAQSLQKLLGTALQAYGNQYNSAYRTTDGKQVKYRDPLTFLEPEARKIYDAISSGAALKNVKSGPDKVHTIVTPGGGEFEINAPIGGQQ